MNDAKLQAVLLQQRGNAETQKLESEVARIVYNVGANAMRPARRVADAFEVLDKFCTENGFSYRVEFVAKRNEFWVDIANAHGTRLTIKERNSREVAICEAIIEAANEVTK